MVKPFDETALEQLPMSGGTMQVCFESAADIADQLQQFLGQNGLFITTNIQPKPFSEFDLVLTLPSGETCEPLRARLVQIVPYGTPGLMLQLFEFPDSHREQLEAAAREAPAADISEPIPAEDAEFENDEDEDEEPLWKQRAKEQRQADLNAEERMTLSEKLRKMLPNDRARLAKRANRNVRTILMRDTEPLVILFLLKNPHLGRQEAIEISRLTSLNHQSITALLANKAWSQNEEIRHNLVRNPKTPLSIVLKLLPSLNMKHLREIAKDGGGKSKIKQAALRLVLQRNNA